MREIDISFNKLHYLETVNYIMMQEFKISQNSYTTFGPHALTVVG